MQNFIKTVGYLVMLAIVLDLVLVGFIILQIGNGIETAHIPFWDAQIRFISSIFF